jgi:methyl-accepting chemotaxis protein
MNNSASKRRNVFIKKAFQARFMAGVIGLILLSSLSSALLIYWVTGGDLQAQAQSAHANIVTAWQRLGLSILLGNVVAIIVAGAAGIASVLYASHKIAGPLYRFETLCREVGDGNLNTITKLREDDQLQDLAKSFSTMVIKLRDRRDLRQRLLNDINQQIGYCALKSGEIQPLELQNVVAKLANLVAELEKLDK